MKYKGVLIHGQGRIRASFIKERFERKSILSCLDLAHYDELQVLTLVDHRGLHWTGCLCPAPRDQCEETGKGTAAQSSQVPQERAVACISCGLSLLFHEWHQ